jgi:hypothetical protein
MKMMLAYLLGAFSPEGGHAVSAPVPVTAAPLQTPVRLCGMTAPSVPDMMRQIASSAAFRPAGGSRRFRAYDRVDVPRQDWVVTTEADAAHPAVTCRQIMVINGERVAVRTMQCAGPLAACASLARQFKEVDEALGRELRGER